MENVSVLFFLKILIGLLVHFESINFHNEQNRHTTRQRSPTKRLRMFPRLPLFSGRKFSKTSMLASIMATFSGSLNWARKHSSEAAVVTVPRPLRRSRTTVSSPAFDEAKAVVTPTIPFLITQSNPVALQWPHLCLCHLLLARKI